MEKIYVKIIAEHDQDGKIRPLALKWEDGRVFEIDRVTDVRQAASLKAGGQGIRYMCKIKGKKICLFCDDGRWFIE